MLHAITTRLEICIDINVKINEVDNYTEYLLLEFLDFL